MTEPLSFESNFESLLARKVTAESLILTFVYKYKFYGRRHMKISDLVEQNTLELICGSQRRCMEDNRVSRPLTEAIE